MQRYNINDSKLEFACTRINKKRCDDYTGFKCDNPIGAITNIFLAKIDRISFGVFTTVLPQLINNTLKINRCVILFNLYNTQLPKFLVMLLKCAYLYLDVIHFCIDV